MLAGRGRRQHLFGRYDDHAGHAVGCR
nr:hypothetical protein [Burkholderia sola]